MNCTEEMGPLLSRYVDGELTADETGRVEDHCTTCPECRELLSLFQRNERVLGDAIGHDAFGHRVLDQVMVKLEEETVTAPVARPLPWRRWIPAAAAVLAAAAVSWAVSSRVSRESIPADHYQALRQTTDALLATNDELQRQLRILTERQVVSRLPDRALAYVEDTPRRTVRIAARFQNYDQFETFSVRRRREEEKEWETLTSGLLSPEYEDSSALPGQVYRYVITAHRADGSTLDSLPQRVLLPDPGHIDPRTAIQARCIDIGLENQVSRFRLTRYVDGNPVHCDVIVRRGEMIGKPEEIPGVGRVDFSTGWTLESLDEGDQLLTMETAVPQIEESTGTVIENADGTPVVKYERRPIVTRPSRRATLRKAGQKNGVDLWEDQSAILPQP